MKSCGISKLSLINIISTNTILIYYVLGNILDTNEVTLC